MRLYGAKIEGPRSLERACIDARLERVQPRIADELKMRDNEQSVAAKRKQCSSANGHVGTRTLFPLSRDRLLIITHLQFVRDPWLNPLKPRVNARAFQAPRPLDLRAIQTHRELQQDEVIRINLVLKKRATRFVAASNKDWLYPEEQASTDHWSKLDDDWFLMPNPYKVPFTTGFSAGWDDGRSWASDEHGRTPGHPDYEDGRLRDREWAQHNKAKLAWARKREGRSLSQVLEFNYIEDEIMREDLAKYHEERQRHRRDKHNN